MLRGVIKQKHNQSKVYLAIKARFDSVYPSKGNKPKRNLIKTIVDKMNVYKYAPLRGINAPKKPQWEGEVEAKNQAEAAQKAKSLVNTKGVMVQFVKVKR